MKQGKLMLILHKESYPETTMWAIVPEHKWKNSLQTTEAVLNLVWEQVTGQSLTKAIQETEKDFLLRAQGVPENLQEQLRKLTEAMEEATLDVNPATEDDEPMSMEELTEAENNLLYSTNREDPVWDSPSA